MMRRLAFACAIFLSSFHANAQTYLQCTFGQGIPSDFTCIDGDQNTPSTDMANIGFSVGKAWVAYSPDKTTDSVACSTSWYTPSGTSDDWMITPALQITSDQLAICWKAMAADKKYRDGYTVYISTTGNTREDFTDEPVFSVDQEENAWTRHEIQLSGYNGKTIYVAFVNNSNNKSRLYVDDIIISAPSTAYLTVEQSPITNIMGPQTISGRVFTASEQTINGYSIGIDYDGEEVTQYVDTTLTNADAIPFEFEDVLPMKAHETKDYTVWVEANGERFTSPLLQLTSYGRKTLVEECTATWCAWCVRGIYYLERVEQNFPNQAVNVTIHAWADSDPMYCQDYVEQLNEFFNTQQIPKLMVDRCSDYIFDPTYVERGILERFEEEPVLAAMELEGDADADTKKVTARTRLYFGADHPDAHYALNYVIYEDSVHVPGDSAYYQHNAYAGGSNGKMGGFEDKPAWISSDEMYFREVSRCIVAGKKGIEGSVPSSLVKDQPYEYEYTFDLPDNLLSNERVYLVAMLVDTTDNHVVTCEKVHLAGLSTAISNTPTVKTVENTGGDRWYSPSGMLLNAPQRGLNILRRSDGTTVKVLVR
ncbi:MAG: choice-of-anchor J domain-containing protein [Prevotella sp.]|jgi:thiol-disulfide isomerase/thioredoxin